MELNLDLHDYSKEWDSKNKYEKNNDDNVGDIFSVDLLKWFWFFLWFCLFGLFLRGNVFWGKSDKNVRLFVFDGSIFEKFFIIELNLKLFAFILIFNMIRVILMVLQNVVISMG